MQRPTIFTITTVWDAEAGVWAGHCDERPAAASAASLDSLLADISAMASDVLPDNHPHLDPGSVFLQLTALSDAVASAA
jgi:hypothetical protein